MQLVDGNQRTAFSAFAKQQVIQLANFILRNHHATSSSATQTSRVCHTATISSGAPKLGRGNVKAGVPRRQEKEWHSMWDALVERLVEVCRPDDDSKDAERSVAADEEPSDGRRGYTIQRWR